MATPLFSLPTPLLAVSWAIGLTAVLFALVSLVMMLIILVQRPKGGGLSGAFGGSASNEGAFIGGKIGDVLTYLTVAFFVAFIVLAMTLTWATTPDVAAGVGSDAEPVGSTRLDGDAPVDPDAPEAAEVEADAAAPLDAQNPVRETGFGDTDPPSEVGRVAEDGFDHDSPRDDLLDVHGEPTGVIDASE